MTAVSELLDIPLENLLTPETLRRLAWAPPQPLDLEAVKDALRDLGARRWQIDATAQVILHAFVDAGQTNPGPVSEPS